MNYFLLTFLPAVARLVMWAILTYLIEQTIMVDWRASIIVALYLAVGWRHVYGPGFRWVERKVGVIKP